MTFRDKPRNEESDEIKLAAKYQYKQAFWLKRQAMLGMDIPDVTWIEDNIMKITQSAASKEHKS